MPQADTEAMQGPSRRHRQGRRAQALLILDQLGWHTTGKLDIPANIALVPCRRLAPSSTPSKTSGNICGKTISATACAPTTPRSSMLVRMLGANSSPKQAGSLSSHGAIGHSPVRHSEGWHHM
jgi:hypothetical protein